MWVLSICSVFRFPTGQGTPTVTRNAFGSGAHQDKLLPIWEAVHAFEPDVFFFSGDNTYGDSMFAIWGVGRAFPLHFE